MVDFGELCSDKAIVCRREVNCEQGGAVIWMVCLADGFLLDCGSSSQAHERACRLAHIINEADPSILDMKRRIGV